MATDVAIAGTRRPIARVACRIGSVSEPDQDEGARLCPSSKSRTDSCLRCHEAPAAAHVAAQVMH